MSDEFFSEDDDAFALEDEMLMLRDTFSDQFGFLPVYDHEISDDEIIKNLFKTSEAVKGFYKNYLKHTNTGEVQ